MSNMKIYFYFQVTSLKYLLTFWKKNLIYVKNVDPKCHLECVCKEFRNLLYLKQTEFAVHVDALSEDSGIKFMQNTKELMHWQDLKRLTIIGLQAFGKRTSNVNPVIELFLSEKFRKLESLTLKGFALENCFFALLAAFCHLKRSLSALKCVSCGDITVGQLKYALEQIPTLRYCDVKCNLQKVNDVHVFAEIANNLVGEVNLNLNNF